MWTECHFEDLAKGAMLVDCTGGDDVEYSIVRRRGEDYSRFRCDLCLVSDYFRPWVSVRYDHSTRSGPAAFTDHSGLLIDLPASLEPSLQQTGRLFSWRMLDGPVRSDHSVRGQSSHKTAMGRVNESAVARMVIEHIVPKLRPRRVLDHGCGRGADVRYYARHGLEATGYDPSPTFGFDERPYGSFDLVVSAFVLNVLADPWQRLEVLRAAGDYLAPDTGRLMVVTRSSDVVQRAALQGKWSPYNDGFLSSMSKDTFQRGVEESEILALGSRLGLRPAPEHGAIPRIEGATRVLLCRK